MGMLLAIDGPGFITKLPARLADLKDNLQGPIVVGSVDKNGHKAPSSEELQHGRMLWATGVDITCAETSPDLSSYITASGTSFGKSSYPSPFSRYKYCG